MKRRNDIILLILTVGLIMPAAAAQQPRQEPFSNPAMEPADEFQRTFTAARVLMREGKLDGAIKEFMKAASLRGEQCAQCFQFIGQMYLQMNKHKDAAAYFSRAIALKPANEAELNNALGVALYLQNDKKTLEEAAAALRRAIELSGGKIIKAHYNLGYALIKLGRADEGVAALKTYLELSPTAPNAGEVQAIIAHPAMANEKFAPAFRVKSSAGDDLSLERFKGKVVLLDFWAVWCAPCRVAMPKLKQIWQTYGGKDQFVMIGVSLDRDASTFEDYVKKEGLTWPQYFDGRGWDNQVSRLYGVNSIPHTVLIDENGVVQAVGLRGGALSKKIGELLKKLESQ
jgi:tetratricopeptide (TPR) repeat protein